MWTMNKTTVGILVIAVIITAVIGFTSPRTGSSTKTMDEQSSVAKTVEEAKVFDGHWPGIGGNDLLITKLPEAGYIVSFISSKGPITTNGTLSGDTLVITRDGKDYTLRTGTGADTGVKEFAEKKNCIIVQKSEGYCRN